MLLRLLQLGCGNELRRAVGRDDGGAVCRFDEYLQVWGRGAAGHVLQRKRVDVALVCDEVEVGTDAGFGRMNKAEVANHIDDPKILIARSSLHDLLCRRNFNQRRVLQLGKDRHNVLRVVLDGARRGVLGECGGGRSESKSKDKRYAVHGVISLALGVVETASARGWKG